MPVKSPLKHERVFATHMSMQRSKSKAASISICGQGSQASLNGGTRLRAELFLPSGGACRRLHDALSTCQFR